MLKNDTLKNGTSRVGLYGSAPPGLGKVFITTVATECSNLVHFELGSGTRD